MATVVQAVRQLLDGLTNLPEMWLTEIPENEPVAPSLVLTHLGDMPEYHIGPMAETMVPQIEKANFSLEVYDIDSDVAEEYADEIKTAFANAILTIGTDSNVRAYRESYLVEGTKLRDAEGRQVYCASMQYSLKYNTDK